jgi:hypothetical protein
LVSVSALADYRRRFGVAADIHVQKGNIMSKIQTALGCFPTKKACIEAIRVILYDGEVNQPIASELHKSAVSELFYIRRSKIAELKGRAVVDWIKLDAMNRNRCFAALLSDGSHIHFSYLKGLRKLVAASKQ